MAKTVLEPNHHWKWFRARGQAECPQKHQRWHLREPHLCLVCDYAKKTAEQYAALVTLSPYEHELNPEGTACAEDCSACLWVKESA